MGETLSLFRSSFNKSLRIESRPERLTGEPGASAVTLEGDWLALAVVRLLKLKAPWVLCLDRTNPLVADRAARGEHR